MNNPFDHSPSGGPPGEGEVLARDGQKVLGTRGHRGYDWLLPPGTEVLAAGPGEVLRAGAVPAFHCALLRREVADQVAVVIAHAAPDGSVWETSYHHLSSVEVAVGDHVAVGQLLGRSGATGCAQGPHLHFQVERVDDGRHRAVDPYGVAPGRADPWGQEVGLSSPWMWRSGAAPRWVRERQRTAVDPDLPVSVDAIRYQGWNDEHHPGQEVIRVRVLPDAALPEGWSVRVGDGRRVMLGPLPAGAEVQVMAGSTPAGPGDRLVGPGPFLGDGGGVIELLAPDDRVVQSLAWGLASRRARAAIPREGRACPVGQEACVPLPVSGPVAQPSWSPDGRRLAFVVGEVGQRELLVGEVQGDGLSVSTVPIAGGVDAAHPAWLSEAVVVFDAAVSSGSRRPFYAVIGMRGAAAFSEQRLPGELTVTSARRGVVILRREADGAVDLYAWHVGQEEPSPLTADRRPEVGGDLSADLEVVVFSRSDEIYGVRLADGQRTTLATGVGEVSPVRAVGAGVAWYGSGKLHISSGAPRGLAAEAVDGAAAWAVVGEDLVLVRDGELRGLGPWASLARDLPGAAAVEELAAWRAGDAWRVAWTAPAAGGGPITGLYWLHW